MTGLAGDLIALGYGLEETHVSRVFIGEKEVWKVKKPVRYGFLDYGTLEKRKRACEAEVDLNRRFTPDVYLGIVPVVRDSHGRHKLGGEGTVADWAVHMVRLPESDRADRRLETGALPIAWIKSLAERLAGFHAGSRSDRWTAHFGSLEALEGNLEDNISQSGTLLAGLLGPEFAEGLATRLRRSLKQRSDVVRERMDAGRVRDGHGDLRLSQVYFDSDGRARILDCIEFDDRFRYGDVCSDIAFLSMDMACRGRRILADVFLAAYAKASGDYGLYSMVDYFEAYRACVRGKVACLRAEDPEAGEQVRLSSAEDARRHFRFADSLLGQEKPRPLVVAVGGGIATGKSTLADSLGDALGAAVIASDSTRKQMAGLAPHESGRDALHRGLYSPENTAKVYAEMFRRAGKVWESGRSVVVDATFRAARHRGELRSAAVSAGCSFLFIECLADASLCRERIRQRSQGPTISDADLSVLDDLLGRREQVTGEVPDGECLALNTESSPGSCLDASLEAIRRKQAAEITLAPT